MRSFVPRLALLSLAAVVAFAPGVSAIDGKCRALAMSGGGDKAAYEAGVIRGLVENLPAIETSYDVVTGISAGSTVTAAFSVFAIGDEAGVVAFAQSIMSDLNQSSIFTQWPGGVIEGLLHHSSFFDSTPLRDLVTDVLSDKQLSPDRVTCMGAANMGSGEFERFCDHDTIEDVVNATIASAAIPGVFIDQTIDGQTYIDGSVLVSVDVIGAVEQCLALGYEQSAIIVDTVECGGANLTQITGDLPDMTVVPVLLRALAMNMFAKSERDFSAAEHAYPDVTFRYRIHPTEDIPGSGIDFNRTEMIWMESLGAQDAKDAVQASIKGRHAHGRKPVAVTIRD